MFPAAQRTTLRRSVEAIAVHITLSFCFLIAGCSRPGNAHALLSGTLRTFQVHACDGEELKLECLPNTVISIYYAHYNRHVPEDQHCPSLQRHDPGDSSSSQPVTSLHNTTSSFNNNETTDCSASDSLRYSLLQTVEAGCREQRICKFMTSPQSFGGIDPCPGVRKYAEVAYKCRPNTFYNKVICGGNQLQLKCNKSSRIVIFSASFGSTADGVPECPQASQIKSSDSPVKQQFPECQVSFATEIVMSSCHAKKKCSLAADIGTFGDPGCPKSTVLHLKVVYTCVPKDVVKDLDIGNTDKVNIISNSMDDNEANDYTGFVEEPRYVPESVGSESRQNQAPNSGQIGESFVGETLLKKGDLISWTTKKQIVEADKGSGVDSDSENCTIPEVKVIGFVSDWISAVNFLKKNTERFILYLLVSICGSLLCFLVVLSSRLYIQKRRAVKKVREDYSGCTPFGALSDQNDDLLDQLDGITTLTEPLNHSHGHNQTHHHTIQVVRYGNGRNGHSVPRSSTVRRQDSDTNPRSLARGLNNYYYS